VRAHTSDRAAEGVVIRPYPPRTAAALFRRTDLLLYPVGRAMTDGSYNVARTV